MTTDERHKAHALAHVERLNAEIPDGSWEVLPEYLEYTYLGRGVPQKLCKMIPAGLGIWRVETNCGNECNCTHAVIVQARSDEECVKLMRTMADGVRHVHQVQVRISDKGWETPDA